MPEMHNPQHSGSPGRLSPRWILLGISGAVVLGAAFIHAVTAPPDEKNKAKPPAPVEVAAVSVKTVTVAEHTIGTVVANSTVNVTSQVAGQVMAAAFKEGQLVRKGDVLFRLDPRPFQAALDQAMANLARDQASLEAARHDQARYETLFKQNAISAQQRDQYTAQAGALTGSVRADLAAVAIARLNLEYASIRSPVDGKTGPILIQPGNLVKANDTAALVVVTQIQPIKVSFFLPQTDLPRIQTQMARGNLNAEISAHGDSTVLTAPVDFTGNTVNNQTGTIELRATFPNRDARLVPGELVDVSVTMDRLRDAIVVPSTAVNVGPNGHYVYTVDAQSLPHMVPVSVVYDDGSQATVSGKLAAGSAVITEGQLRVEPGKPVAVTGGLPPAPSAVAKGRRHAATRMGSNGGGGSGTASASP